MTCCASARLAMLSSLLATGRGMPPGISDEIDDRPWLRQETAGMDWDPLKY